MNFSYGWDSFTHYPSIKFPFHPVSTSNKAAQEAFDQGLIGIYAFNYEGAHEKFKEASEHDPNLAMAYWGMALALDEKYLTKPNAEQAEIIYALIQKAQLLSEHATSNEKAYIQALSTRLPTDFKIDREPLKKVYAKEMQKLSLEYPDDPDGNTLYAESMMDILGWDLWTHDYKPKGNAEEIVKVLYSVLEKVPYHIGANHYFIHALENAKHPEYALMSAQRLDELAPLFDEWSHLLHTPSHIYMRVGDYKKTIEDGKRAITADEAYLKKHGPQSDYAFHGLTHNLAFLIMAYLWSDCYEGALASAQYMAKTCEKLISDMPGFQYQMLYLPEVYLYFHRHQEILDMPEPDKKWQILHAYWHFSRALVFCELKEWEKADLEKVAFLQEKKSLEKEKEYDESTFTIAEAVLHASCSYVHDEKEKSLRYLQQAIKKQDSIDYLEWYEPLRQTLGTRLLEMNRPQEAEIAFREGLKNYPQNGRLLSGLSKSLKVQGKEYYWAEREAQEALRSCSHPTDAR